MEGEESLEQLRALDLGKTIHVKLVDEAGWGINSRADYDAFVKWWREGVEIGAVPVAEGEVVCYGEKKRAKVKK